MFKTGRRAFRLNSRCAGTLKVHQHQFSERISRKKYSWRNSMRVRSVLKGPQTWSSFWLPGQPEKGTLKNIRPPWKPARAVLWPVGDVQGPLPQSHAAGVAIDTSGRTKRPGQKQKWVCPNNGTPNVGCFRLVSPKETSTFNQH